MENLPATLEAVLIGGDLSKLTPTERVVYYHKVCGSLGLNPLTMPFQYLNLNGKLVLYATKGATQQLAAIRKISFGEPKITQLGDLYCITISCSTPSGRTDSEMAAVDIKGSSGEKLANLMMKCMTKAKRRAILSICSLNMLDESEVETIPGARIEPLPSLQTPKPTPRLSNGEGAVAPQRSDLIQKQQNAAWSDSAVAAEMLNANLTIDQILEEPRVDKTTGEVLEAGTKALAAIRTAFPGSTMESVNEPTEDGLYFYKLPWEMPGYDMKPIRKAITQIPGYEYDKANYMYAVPQKLDKLSNFPFAEWETDINGRYLIKKSSSRTEFFKWKQKDKLKTVKMPAEPSPEPEQGPATKALAGIDEDLDEIPF